MNTEKSNEIHLLFSKQKGHQLIQKMTTAKDRIALLRKLQAALPAIEADLVEALRKDLAKPPFETRVFELQGLIGAIDLYCANIEDWMKPEVRASAINPNATVEIRNEARGVILIIGPWNVPFTLVLEPLVTALAAGNCAILKPSEMTPNVSKLIAEFIPTVFAPEVVAVVEGGVEETSELLKLPFDHIFFTGSPNVGKVVMEAASKNLTSVTLELGGKSPFIIDESADLEKAALTIVHKKTINAGQICIAPDYLFIKKKLQQPFLELFEKVNKDMYFVSDQFTGEDISRIINQRNYDRLKGLYEDAVAGGAEVAIGGEFDDSRLQIQPTVLINVPMDSKIMGEEIFGPILPIINYEELDEVIEHINKGSKPLALYIFSNDKNNVDRIISQTSSGGITVNEALMHVIDPSLPFGGINGSGMGAYHGIYGFKELSHQKSIFYAGDDAIDLAIYPPFKEK